MVHHFWDVLSCPERKILRNPILLLNISSKLRYFSLETLETELKFRVFFWVKTWMFPHRGSSPPTASASSSPTGWRPTASSTSSTNWSTQSLKMIWQRFSKMTEGLRRSWRLLRLRKWLKCCKQIRVSLKSSFNCPLDIDFWRF